MWNKYPYNQGQALITTVVILISLASATIAGIVNPIINDYRSVKGNALSHQSFFTAESGTEDGIYRLKTNKKTSAIQTLSLGNAWATTTISTSGQNKVVTATGNASQYLRSLRSVLSLGTGASFNFGVQSDQGGFVMENNSSVSGNLYSNGSIIGSGSSIIRGDVISAGPAGLVDGIHATGTVYAHTIRNVLIDGDAYYQVISNSTVRGASHPNSADQATSSLPISDDMITEWENDATAGITITTPCPYVLNSNATIGPAKIDCNLEISGNPTITIAGPIWVKGNITIRNNPIIKVASAIGNQSVAIVADNPTNRLTSSKIILDNGAEFRGSGTAGSYVLLVSQNNSAEMVGIEQAINVDNSVNGALLLYAGHGEIRLDNSDELKQITAYRIRLRNSAEVKYELGIASLLFTSGPGGTWKLSDWFETE
ncbi:MAG: hypothetical protein HYV76_00080 [Candidatus Vogelbacteria bacterium]|nr:hypothetical protein [Candidatus Vogelbacteria bacterium]